MRKILFLPLILTVLYASHENIGVTPESRSLAESFVATAFGVNGIFGNPGGVAFGEKVEFLASYEKPFGSADIKGLSTVTAGIKYRHFGLGISEYSLKLEGEYSGRYAEGLYSLSYGGALGSIGVGANVNLYKFQDPRFGTDYTAGLDLGLCSKVSEWVGAGVFYRNILGSKIRGDNLPQFLDAGLSISIQNLSRTLLNFRMAPASSVVLMVGEEVSVASGIVKLRAGFNYGENLKKASFGLGVTLKGITVNYGFSTNFELSPAHAIGINFGR